MNISVIIPAWNAERHIARAIRSVLAQTRPAGEIIVVDDGSTDGTTAAVRTFGFGDAVRLIQQTNAGASVARNTGLAAATGDWIAFLDADDEWMPEKLRLQGERHRQFPELKWSFTRLEWARPEWSQHRLAHPEATPQPAVFDDYLEAYAKGYFISTITVMIHRSVFETTGGFEPGMKRAQDNDLWFRIAYAFPKVGYIPQSLAVYHLDTPNSSTKINDRVDFMIDHIERHRELSQTFNRAEAFAPCITVMLQVWIRQLAAQNRNADARTLLERFREDLGPRFRREMALRLRMPGIVQTMMDRYLMLKSKMQGKR